MAWIQPPHRADAFEGASGPAMSPVRNAPHLATQARHGNHTNGNQARQPHWRRATSETCLRHNPPWHRGAPCADKSSVHGLPSPRRPSQGPPCECQWTQRGHEPASLWQIRQMQYIALPIHYLTLNSHLRLTLCTYTRLPGKMSTDSCHPSKRRDGEAMAQGCGGRDLASFPLNLLVVDATSTDFRHRVGAVPAG